MTVTFLRIHHPVLLSFFALSIFASFLYRQIHISKNGIENNPGSISVNNSDNFDKSKRLDRFEKSTFDKTYQKNRNNEMIINMIHHALPPDDADIAQLGDFLILYMNNFI